MPLPRFAQRPHGIDSPELWRKGGPVMSQEAGGTRGGMVEGSRIWSVRRP